jgi:uncharacterized protein (TIGR03066 family)
MNALRLSGIVLVSCVFAALTSAVLAGDEKAVDKDKIVGTWKITKERGGPPVAPITLQFTKDGKLKLKGLTKNLNEGLYAHTIEGTYKFEGKKLIITLQEKGTEQKETMTMTIKTLTEKKLVLFHDKRKEEAEFEKK